MTQQLIEGAECRTGATARCVALGGVTVFVPGGKLDLSRPITIVDPGGPGLDALAQGAAAAPFSAIPNAAVVLEPWVTREPADRCRAALDGYMRQIRGDADPANGALRFTRECSAELSVEADFAVHGVAEVAADLRSRGAGQLVLLGISFGAQRVRPAASSNDSIILVAPFVGRRSLAHEISRRTKHSYRILGLSERERRLLGEVGRDLPLQLPHRSTSLTRTDLHAAVIAAAYDPQSSKQPLLRDARALRKAQTSQTPARLTWLPKAADYLEGRYRTESYYRGLIGYFGNYCSAFRDRDLTTQPTLRGAFLTRFHVACTYVASPKSLAMSSEAAGCIVLGQDDPVASSADLVEQAYPRAILARVSGRGHATGAELSAGIAMARAVAMGGDLTCRGPS